MCGGRGYFDNPRAFEWLDSLHLRPLRDLIINGGSTGADHCARRYCAERRIPCLTVPADWSTGLGAGPIRNLAMLEWKPTLVVAFPGGKGTANMVMAAKLAGVKVMEVPK